MNKALLLGLAGAVLVAACGTSSVVSTPSAAYEIVGVDGQENWILVDPSISADKPALTEIGEYVCRAQNTCQALFWDDPLEAPRRGPMTNAQDAAMVASYTVNRNANFTEMLLFEPSK